MITTTPRPKARGFADKARAAGRNLLAVLALAAFGIGLPAGCAARSADREASDPPHGAASGASSGDPAPGTAPVPAAPEGHEGSHDATMHHAFTDAEGWSKVFDAADRDDWQKPADVVAGLAIRPGMIVADLGAGTGYFESRLSSAVGPAGLVLAIDPEPDMVKHLGGRARKDGLGNVLPVLGLPDEPFLPRGRVDRVLIVDTYHHIDDRLAYFGRMRDALAPGGRIAVVDFHKRPLPVGPPPEHKLEREFVVNEMTQAGWRLADEKTSLPYQYFLIFEPVAKPAGGATR
jgi:ubiquinone/menaquinone biosynthesis C-methylase UbiE